MAEFDSAAKGQSLPFQKMTVSTHDGGTITMERRGDVYMFKGSILDTVQDPPKPIDVEMATRHVMLGQPLVMMVSDDRIGFGGVVTYFREETGNP
jgi:hypothetical protein